MVNVHLDQEKLNQRSGIPSIIILFKDSGLTILMKKTWQIDFYAWVQNSYNLMKKLQTNFLSNKPILFMNRLASIYVKSGNLMQIKNILSIQVAKQFLIIKMISLWPSWNKCMSKLTMKLKNQRILKTSTTLNLMHNLSNTNKF